MLLTRQCQFDDFQSTTLPFRTCRADGGARESDVRRLKLMIAPLAKFIDWSALQMAYVVSPVRHAPEPKWRLAEALEFLNGPDFFPAAIDPARMEFDGRRNFRF